MDKNCDSPLRKKPKYTGSMMSFDDIESDLYHLATIKDQVITLIHNLYKFELSHTAKYLQDVDVQCHYTPQREILEVGNEFLQNSLQNQEKFCEELSRKMERHHLLMQILEKKASCKISKMVDNI